MPQSLVRNYVHITFSTKYRQKLITKEIEKELFSYIGGVCKNMECFPIVIGGHLNHIHILCLLSQKVALMNLLKDIKSFSSGWIKTKSPKFHNFYWQNGYGAFSVNANEINIVEKYINNQERHHLSKTFKEEYLEFLKKYNVDYDERYVWD